MSIFSHLDEQVQRLDALEAHVRVMTEAVQQNQLDIAAGLVALLALQSQIEEKVDTTDVDPAIAEMNAKIGVAREEFQRASAAAEDRWADMQAGVQASMEDLRTRAAAAREKIVKLAEQ